MLFIQPRFVALLGLCALARLSSAAPSHEGGVQMRRSPYAATIGGLLGKNDHDPEMKRSPLPLLPVLNNLLPGSMGENGENGDSPMDNNDDKSRVKDDDKSRIKDDKSTAKNDEKSRDKDVDKSKDNDGDKSGDKADDKSKNKDAEKSKDKADDTSKAKNEQSMNKRSKGKTSTAKNSADNTGSAHHNNFSKRSSRPSYPQERDRQRNPHRCDGHICEQGRPRDGDNNHIHQHVHQDIGGRRYGGW